MKIGHIENGIVLDHIAPGNAMNIYNVLKLDKLDCTVALITNAGSAKMGTKDIIKISTLLDIDLDILGYLDPGITVNVIRDGEVAEQRHVELPQRVVGVIKCRNPRCITSVEREIVHEFKLTDPVKKIYRCIYCEQKA